MASIFSSGKLDLMVSCAIVASQVREHEETRVSSRVTNAHLHLPSYTMTTRLRGLKLAPNQAIARQSRTDSRTRQVCGEVTPGVHGILPHSFRCYPRTPTDGFPGVFIVVDLTGGENTWQRNASSDAYKASHDTG